MELSASEIELCREVGFDRGVAVALKRATGKPVERAFQRTEENWEMQPAQALSSADEEGYLSRLRAELPDDYRAYWGIRRHENGSRIGHELVVLKDPDPLAIVRLRQTDGCNYEIQHEDVLARLEGWHLLYQIDILGADHDQVEMKFGTLPDDLVSFAEEVYWFCEDITEPEGDKGDEEREPELFRRALELPAVSPEFAAKYNAQIREVFDDYEEIGFLGIRMLAASIEKQRGLFLWWD